jgi:UDP-N-acetylglucosamine kinase
LTDTTTYVPDANPVSVFMAGSPGAGKTEASLELIHKLEADAKDVRILRIDPDELRYRLPQYNGHNSWLFQGAVATLVDKVWDFAHDQDQSFILDGTLSDYGRARSNIDRCLKSGRKVQILYVYQDPLLAWDFVRAREAEEGRNIPVDRFIEQYYKAREVVNQLKSELQQSIAVDLLVKPNDTATRLYRAGIDQIDYHVPESYDRGELERVLRSR